MTPAMALMEDGARAIFLAAKSKVPWDGIEWDALPEDARADYRGQFRAVMEFLWMKPLIVPSADG